MQGLIQSAFVLVCAAGFAVAQAPQQGPVVVSPEVTAEKKIVFRILAPKAAGVVLQAGDIQGLPKGGPQLVKGENGVWETTVGPVTPGAYRYRFAVDGVPVIDPRNPASSESNTNGWSLVHVPGIEYQDTAQVPHGAVAAVHYWSTALGRHRRMHVYTPPGYELGKGKYPVFYLLHGASDSDDSWSSVGRAGFILDNLIAAKKAKPMIMVMPAGHTSAGFGGGGMNRAIDEFGDDFVKDIMPYVDKHYRVLEGRKERAIAGLSMGGMQTLNIGFSHLDKFAYIGVFSSGIFGGGPRTPAAAGAPAAPAPSPVDLWEKKQAATLDDAKLKQGLKLLWIATGKDDFLLKSSQATVEMLKKHGFAPVYRETEGAHTWLVWRNYMNEFVPQLFQ